MNEHWEHCFILILWKINFCFKVMTKRVQYNTSYNVFQLFNTVVFSVFCTSTNYRQFNRYLQYLVTLYHTSNPVVIKLSENIKTCSFCFKVIHQRTYSMGQMLGQGRSYPKAVVSKFWFEQFLKKKLNKYKQMPKNPNAKKIKFLCTRI